MLEHLLELLGLKEETFEIFGIGVSITNFIDLFQSVILIATILVMMRTSNTQKNLIEKQINQLNDTVRLAAHNDIFAKIATLYKLYYDDPSVAKKMWHKMSDLEDVEVKKQFIFFHIMDILHNIHINKSSLDDSLSKDAWNIWANKIMTDDNFRKMYENIKNEYPPELRRAIDENCTR